MGNKKYRTEFWFWHLSGYHGNQKKNLKNSISPQPMVRIQFYLVKMIIRWPSICMLAEIKCFIFKNMADFIHLFKSNSITNVQISILFAECKVLVIFLMPYCSGERFGTIGPLLKIYIHTAMLPCIYPYKRPLRSFDFCL